MNVSGGIQDFKGGFVAGDEDKEMANYEDNVVG